MKINKILLTCTTLTALLSSPSYASEAQQAGTFDDVIATVQKLQAASVAKEQALVAQLGASQERVVQLQSELDRAGADLVRETAQNQYLKGELRTADQLAKTKDEALLDLIILVKLLAADQAIESRGLHNFRLPSGRSDAAVRKELLEEAESVDILDELKNFRTNMPQALLNKQLDAARPIMDKLIAAKAGK